MYVRPRGIPFPAALAACLTVLTGTAAVVSPAAAQEHEHDESHAHDHGLHFTHPLIAESVSPDTKVRLDYAHRTPGDLGAVEFEAEYAFHRSFSIEVGIPTFTREPGASELAFDDMHGLLKFANYAFEDRGLLLGYGLGFGLPLGDDDAEDDHAHDHDHDHEHTLANVTHAAPQNGGGHGHGSHYELSPYLNAGLLVGSWELVGWTLFNIPTDQDDQAEVGTTLQYQASALYHVGSRVQALVEWSGRTGLSGAPVGRTTADLTPGLRVLPFGGVPLALGLGVSIPMADDRDFDSRVTASAFYHF